MKTKTDRAKTETTHNGNRPANPSAFWIAPGEDIETARRRYALTPKELAAKEADAARRQANVKRDMARRFAMEAEAAERERRVQDAILLTAQKATAQNKKRQIAARRNGMKGAPKPQDGEVAIRRAVADVLKSLRKAGSMKSACMYQIGQHELKFGADTVDAKKHWPALAKHVRKAMCRV